MVSTTQSLVIPAYNEARRLAAGFQRLAPVLQVLGTSLTEIVMVDDGSSDETMRVAHQVYGHLEHFRLVQHPHNLGKGAAVRTGIAHATSAKVIVTDADMSIRPEHFADILAHLDRSSFAPGSRARASKIHYDSLFRTFSGNAFHSMVRHYTSVAVRDTQCGCKGFDLATGRLLAHFGFINSFAYDVELFYLANQLQLRTSPVEVTWDDIGGSTVSLAHGKFELFTDLRRLGRTRYQCPVIEVNGHVDIEQVRRAALHARAVGLVVARSAHSALIVTPRQSAVAAVGIAQSLGGAVRTTTPLELQGCVLEAV